MLKPICEMVDQLQDQELFQSIFNTSPQGILVLDEDGVILFANHSLENVFGYDSGELVQQKLDSLFSIEKKQSYNHLQKLHSKALKDKATMKVALWGQKKDGSQLSLMINLNASVVKDKKVMIIFMTDVTELTRLQNARITEEESRSEAKSIAQIGSWSWNLKTKERHWSNEVYLIYGLPLGDQRLHAQTADSFIYPEDLPMVKQKIADATKNKMPYVYETRIITSEGDLKWVLVNGLVDYDLNGKPDFISGTTQDITILKNAVLALEGEKETSNAASTEMNRAILEALPHIVAINDAKGKFLDIQSGNKFQFPYPIQSIKGKMISDFIPDKNECNTILKAYARVIRSKKKEIIEVTITILDKTIDFEARIVPFEQDKVLVALRDITASKAIQNTLDIRNRALQVAGNGIVIVDAQNPEMPIIYCNKTFMEITGYSHEEVFGVNCRFLQKDDTDQEAIVKISKAIWTGQACRETLRNYRKDGTLFWNELSITPLYNEKSKLTHFIGVQNDVTEIIENRKQLESYAEKLEKTIEGRTLELKKTVEKLVATNLDLESQMASTKVAEEKAKASQVMFTAIAQNFPKGVIIVFNKDFELVYVEGEELDYLDAKKSELEGKVLDEINFLTTIQKSKLKEEIKKTFSGSTISSEVVFKGQSYMVNSTPLHSDHQKINWALFVFNNVTEQKNVQQKLEVALKIEKDLNELKTRFISMASHEFRTPLSAILSSAILIGKQNDAGQEERRMKHVSKIRNNVKNLVVILNDFLSLSKLEEGKVKATPQYFELIKFLKLIVEEMEATEKEGQQIRLKTSETTIAVYLDPKLLSHILINLLSNSIKYSGENQNIVLIVSTTSQQVIFKIIDQGIGIPTVEQEKLFERFFRATNANNIQGTGLGLHIVKQYAELMGGTVSFTSKIGIGSSFEVILPLKLEQ